MPGGLPANGAIASLNKVRRDPLQGKEVIITAGQWKGHRGKVSSLDDRQAIVEISSICRKIAIDRAIIEGVDSNTTGDQTTAGADYDQGGRTFYDGGKTPMQFNTPSYYPHSPHGWGAQTPAPGTDCKQIFLH